MKIFELCIILGGNLNFNINISNKIIGNYVSHIEKYLPKGNFKIIVKLI